MTQKTHIGTYLSFMPPHRRVLFDACSHHLCCHRQNIQSTLDWAAQPADVRGLRRALDLPPWGAPWELRRLRGAAAEWAGPAAEGPRRTEAEGRKCEGVGCPPVSRETCHHGPWRIWSKSSPGTMSGLK